MMKKFTTFLCGMILLLGISGNAAATPLDLSSWSALTLDYSGYQPAGNWVLSSANTTVTQTVNADPSFYLNNLNQTSYKMDGTWRVTTTSDDDFMGFVFGYQNSSNFYLFDWKQASQSGSGYGYASEGMTISKMTGSTGDGLTDLTIPEFWQNTVDNGDRDILATNHGDTGWADNTLYNFHLDFEPGEFSILVTQGTTELWDITVYDSTFTYGYFGFYNFSQSTVEYSGFEQTGGVIVDPIPEPATLLLFGTGLIGIVGLRRKFKK